MSIISETGQVRTIDTRAMVPFYEAVGSDNSLAYAERIVDSTWIRGCVPDDAPYVDFLRELIRTTAQMAAESGYDFRHGDIDFLLHSRRAKSDFTASFLAIRDMGDELELGKLFNVGTDIWDRWTFHERVSLVQALDRTNRDDDKIILTPSNQVLDHLHVSGVISSGIMRMLNEAVYQGYLWGHGGPQPLTEKVELLTMSDDPRDWVGYYDPQINRIIKPLPIEDTIYKRSLAAAEKVRERESRLNAFFRELIA